jgi:crotonobetainyl-CoA:carnitine CoA-transferase CaiB-like acyl-CoA transferase
VSHYDELKPLLVEKLRAKTRAGWGAALKAAGVPCGAVREIAEALQDDHLHARNMIEAVGHALAGPINVLGVPIKLSDTPGSVRTAPPALGQHTDAILRDNLGFSDEEIARLREAGAI